MLLVPMAIPLLIVVSLVYSLLTKDDTYREGMNYSGDLKALENDFRQRFHGRQDYTALPLEELAAQHALLDSSFQVLGRYPHEFVPFSPETPDSALVLTVHGYWTQPDRFTKGDLTAEPTAPDHVAPTNLHPPANPAPNP